MKRKKPTKSSASPAFARPEFEQIEQLLAFMTEHNLEEFEYSRGDLSIRLRRPSAGVVLGESRAAAGAAAGSAHGTAGAVSGSAEGRASEDLHLIKSPIVGTYYGSPTPGAEAFVKIGSHVESGQTLCIVEAMKLMNEIESDTSGEVIRVFVETGQPVEYGQPLFGIRPSRKK
jgi:acetyl-CoA carboxylase biotin carboxyl carrier protein